MKKPAPTKPARADERVADTPGPAAAPAATAGKPPLTAWAREFVRRWNSGSYSLFILHGNVFDIYPIPAGDRVEYLSLKAYLGRRLFPDRPHLLYYDISEGLTFGAADMQRRFFEWLEIYDEVENTDYHRQGPPRDFVRLTPLLRRYFDHLADQRPGLPGVTLVVDFAEKIVPAQEEAGTPPDERLSLVSLLKWASTPDFRRLDIGVVLVTESAAELHADLRQNPHVAQVRLDLPDPDERRRFLGSAWLAATAGGKAWTEWCDLPETDLAARTAGLNLLRIRHLLAEAVSNGERVTAAHLAAGKKRLIEEYCQGLVRFKEPKPGLSLDAVATHAAAKRKLRELAWLIRNQKAEVLERGVLLPGRVGVGKSFLVDCFASECGLPVMELGEFRSKWVGDTELQQARILMTIRALGPVVVVVDEADAVFGTREAEGDSGVSGRVFAAFAAHIGDSSLRGRELWIAMTSRPDLLSIDMKRQGRFGLCIPLFPAQSADEVIELFIAVARNRKIALGERILSHIRSTLGDRPLTGSDVEAILVRARERAVLDGRDRDVQVKDLREAVESFIDPLDPDLLRLQELAAVLACSDRRYLPARHLDADRAALMGEFLLLKMRVGRR